jgi:ATP-dependent DNA helicase PIF1
LKKNFNEFKTILAHLRGQEKICLPVSFTGMAASLLDGGRTATSRFRLPLQFTDTSTSSIRASRPEHIDMCNLLSECNLVIWDEATTAHKYAFECVDRLFRDLCRRPNTPFGGKTILLCGDFRQILPVVKRGTSVDIINACIKNSYIWRDMPVCLKIFFFSQFLNH